MVKFPKIGDYKGYILDADDIEKIPDKDGSIVNTKVFIKTIANNADGKPLDIFHYGESPEEWKNNMKTLILRAKKAVDDRIAELAEKQNKVIVTPEQVDISIAKINDE